MELVVVVELVALVVVKLVEFENEEVEFVWVRVVVEFALVVEVEFV